MREIGNAECLISKLHLAMGTVTTIVKVLILKISLLFPLCVKLYPLKFCAYQKIFSIQNY